MKKYYTVLLVCLVSFAANAAPVTTCTNSCVITHHEDGSITIRDCCGGRVTTTFPPSGDSGVAP